MPVPSSISELSATISLNSPQGSESAKGTVDDYLRAHAGFIKQINDALLGPSVTLPSASTVSIGFASSINITITGSVTISAFDTIAEGALRYITFTGAPTLVHNPVSMALPGAQNIVAGSADFAIFKSLGGGNWKCLTYMRASGTGPVKATASVDGYLAAGDFGTFAAKQNALGYTPYNASNPSGFVTAAEMAGTYLARSGGLMGGNLDFVNAAGIFMRDEVGNPRQLVKMDGNEVNFTVAGGSGINFYNQAGNAVVARLSNVGAFSAVVVTETSDERKKKSWQRAPKDLIERLAGIRKSGLFKWKKGGADGIGVGAQSLEAILPEAVHTDERGNKSVQYGAASMVISVELARKFVAMEARIAQLEAAK